MNGYKMNTYVVRVVNVEDFLDPADNIKVRAVDPLSAAMMAAEVYEEEIRGEYVGEPALLRKEEYVFIFLTDEGYLLEVFNCSCEKAEMADYVP